MSKRKSVRSSFAISKVEDKVESENENNKEENISYDDINSNNGKNIIYISRWKE